MVTAPVFAPMAPGARESHCAATVIIVGMSPRPSIHLSLALACLAIPAIAQQEPASRPAIDPRLYASLSWRNVGPFRGGRVSAAAGAIGQPGVFYAGYPGGGVWKTTSAGAT